MTPEEYETAKARRDDLARKLSARISVNEGYGENTRAIHTALDDINAQISAYEADNP